MAEEEEAAIITEGEQTAAEQTVLDDDNEEVSNEEDQQDQEEDSEDGYIKASRHSFALGDDHYIFDFKDVNSEEEEVEEENVNEEVDSDENEEEEEEDGMEEDNAAEDNMTEQQQEETEREAREAVQKNVTRRMGWFDMIRRLEKKVINEKRMAQSGGYDLSDPFIDDGNLVAQHTTLTIPEPPPFQVIRYDPAEAKENNTDADNETGDSTKRRKGEKVMLTEKQKQQLANWNPNKRTVEILDELRVRAGVLFADKDSINAMPNDFDDLLSEVDIEATGGAKTRPAALVWALTEIFPFHPQTIKIRLRLLQKRRENTELDSLYSQKKKEFLIFMKRVSKENKGKPVWNTETRLKMGEIYHLLEDRVEKYNQLMRLERVNSQLEFSSELMDLMQMIISFFNSDELTMEDLQKEFESSAQDEELEIEENEESAVITEITADQPSEKTTINADTSITQTDTPTHPDRSSKHESRKEPRTELQFWKEEEKIDNIKGRLFDTVEFSDDDFLPFCCDYFLIVIYNRT